MAHSNQIREFVISAKGIDLLDVYLGPSGVLTGSARASREAEDRARLRQQQQDVKRLEAEVRRKRVEMEDQIARLRGEMERDEDELKRKLGYAKNGLRAEVEEREAMAKSRKADGENAGKPARPARRL
jgi:circadian clock protein KaiC